MTITEHEVSPAVGRYGHRPCSYPIAAAHRPAYSLQFCESVARSGTPASGSYRQAVQKTRMNTFKQQGRCLTCALGFVLLASVLCAQPPQTQTPTPAPDQFNTARDVVLQLYPEQLKDRTLHMTAHVDLNLNRSGGLFPEVGLSLTETVRRPNLMTPKEESLGGVVVYFRQTGQIFRLRASGPLVSSEPNTEIRHRVDEHPEWSDERVMSEIRDAGALLLPDDSKSSERALVSRLMRLTPFLGTIEVREVNFWLRNQAQMDAKLPAAELYWSVAFDVLEADGRRRRRKSAIFEPFSGNITFVDAY